MRKFKFRFWDNNRMKMEYTENAQVILINHDDNHHFTMQFTGLVDRNKKEVYEHDIVQQTSTYVYPSGRKVTRIFNRMIIFINGAFHVSNSKGGASKTPYLHPIPMWKQKMEVIGNIYENPELIKTLKSQVK